MSGNHIRNTEGLRAFAEQRQLETVSKVNEAIQRLIKAKAKINFNSVSAEAGVSKAYLYKNADVRARVDLLRKQQEGLPSPGQVKREMSGNSKDVLIAAIRQKIKRLEEENEHLKQESERLRGRLYEQY
ncbi:MAG: DUF6262 family protein [Clostridiaceae bacterium]|nr:DUF6262 family protein [Clostridiaceae bacterium]